MNCPVCTFVNRPGLPRCEMCGTALPSPLEEKRAHATVQCDFCAHIYAATAHRCPLCHVANRRCNATNQDASLAYALSLADADPNPNLDASIALAHSLSAPPRPRYDVTAAYRVRVSGPLVLDYDHDGSPDLPLLAQLGISGVVGSSLCWMNTVTRIATQAGLSHADLHRVGRALMAAYHRCPGNMHDDMAPLFVGVELRVNVVHGDALGPQALTSLRPYDPSLPTFIAHNPGGHYTVVVAPCTVA